MNIKNEFKNPQLGDKGLNHRLEYLAEAFSKNNGESISFSCQDWKSSKAAYRFFDNDNFQAEEILKPHIKQTLNRMNALDENDMSLILHDSSEITFSKNKVFQGNAGYLGSYIDHRNGKEYDTPGLMIYSSLAL